MIDQTLTAREVVARLDLGPHPEGGFFRETWRASETDAAGRSAGSAIYYLLDADSFSHWHAVDADEVWHFYAGAPLVLTTSANGRDAEARHLGPILAAGQTPQQVVPAGVWQSATSLGAWTLVGCTVSPAFDFSGFKLAPPDWRPSPAGPPPQSETPAR